MILLVSFSFSFSLYARTFNGLSMDCPRTIIGMFRAVSTIFVALFLLSFGTFPLLVLFPNLVKPIRALVFLPVEDTDEPRIIPQNHTVFGKNPQSRFYGSAGLLQLNGQHIDVVGLALRNVDSPAVVDLPGKAEELDPDQNEGVPVLHILDGSDLAGFAEGSQV
jgi:hypothetical protein